MAYECRVEWDSLSPEGCRLTTFVVTFPRFLLAEMNTHRALSRNSASSRAIPVEKRIAQIEADPFIPESFGKNQKGMQAVEELDELNSIVAQNIWGRAKDDAAYLAQQLSCIGVHKQLANRLLEPFAWHTAVITATDWANFFALRCHPDAQPEFQKIACMMRDAMAASKPTHVAYGEWHLPFVREDELDEAFDNLDRWKLVSAGRCARVSYLTHDGRRDPDADVDLARRLIEATPKHSSPLEHVARSFSVEDWAVVLDRQRYARKVANMHGREPDERAIRAMEYVANFRGWHQFRHEIADESVRG